MGLLDRVWRVIRANINTLISGAEDPEKVLEQTVTDMQNDLVKLRQAVAQAIATQKRTERQCSQAQSTADEWYRRAQLALQKGQENLAREALTRRKSYQETAKSMKIQVEQQKQVMEKLKQNMRQLEQKISEAKLKKNMYIARARSAKASEKLNEILGTVNTGNALSAFEKMEEKVMQLEAKSEAIAELGTDSLEKQFASLEEGNDIETELEAMKAEMLPGGSNSQLPIQDSSNLRKTES
ncbi:MULTISPECIES: PspA/IM30 family protein [Okeania]|uniref:PspA/IM30 family protein n=2 Tax=Okeania TaxID=1458928 RepID=A0A3N6RZ93_9CYAN|nr:MULTISPECIES: PspA/IM30 family protein [Okeania]NET14480.1 PspA/IM30 family protein [Okeania sp. SIO1H6]NES75263.1 PspA/IM30 family protein [Okeania sp. SIO1H4]NET19276.1 PspA/IM30 family protein [Okeania sp. SIO1H5]NET75922.1 PspA/IM30 family protein [Okeania sp. SIO1F9]NET92871.1 PspA/IM30 family protein [Okeania sp. SIO1H2]